MPVISFFISSNSWMEDSFIAGARAVGYTCMVSKASFPWSHRSFDAAARQQVQADMQEYEATIAALSPAQRPDLLFFCTSDDNLHEPSLQRLSALGIPMVQYHPDMGFLWFRILRYAKYFDIIACAQQQHMSFLQKAGLPVYWLPFGATPSNIGSPAPPFEGVRYLGSPFADRAAILGGLHRAGIPIEVWGHNWDWFPRKQQAPQTQLLKAGFSLPFLSDKQLIDVSSYLWPRLRFESGYLMKKTWAGLKKKWIKPKVFDVEAFYGHLPPACIKGKYNIQDFSALVSSAAINIGFSHMYAARYIADRQYRQMRLRDIEIPMLGGFYLAEYSTDLAHCFEEDKHLVFWKTPQELKEKINYYLERPALRSSIAASGKQHAILHHTWGHRFSRLFALLKK
jgi:hypothetical protein